MQRLVLHNRYLRLHVSAFYRRTGLNPSKLWRLTWQVSGAVWETMNTVRSAMLSLTSFTLLPASSSIARSQMPSLPTLIVHVMCYHFRRTAINFNGLSSRAPLT
ncbi:hypothetical protein FOCG_18464 [Fusarium oxysporum f. sp. radicis-lycopersici 26381]|nr:hypothetical protein FOCG_18464 [Fusarium oxysporum f. sp. radicis-lycopersici 26381]